MTEPKRGCLTCKWADYRKTPTGRLVRGTAILCRFPKPTGEQVKELILPMLSFAQRQYLHIQELYLNYAVYPDQGDGSDCTKWEPKE